MKKLQPVSLARNAGGQFNDLSRSVYIIFFVIGTNCCTTCICRNFLKGRNIFFWIPKKGKDPDELVPSAKKIETIAPKYSPRARKRKRRNNVRAKLISWLKIITFKNLKIFFSQKNFYKPKLPFMLTLVGLLLIVDLRTTVGKI